MLLHGSIAINFCGKWFSYALNYYLENQAATKAAQTSIFAIWDHWFPPKAFLAIVVSLGHLNFSRLWKGLRVCSSLYEGCLISLLSTTNRSNKIITIAGCNQRWDSAGSHRYYKSAKPSPRVLLHQQTGQRCCYTCAISWNKTGLKYNFFPADIHYTSLSQACNNTK